MRKTIIAGNWKMYKTISEAIELVQAIKRELIDSTQIDIVVCPAFTALSEVAKVLKSSNIKLGAQNMYWQDEGAYTGEVSAKMLKDAGCEFVILGHSERRQHFFETDVFVNSKIKQALKTGLSPIVCIGETLREREAGSTFSVIEKQLSGVLDGIKDSMVEKITIAYEPVWAIGTGKTATSAQAEEVHKFIRTLLKKWYNEKRAINVRVLYGGSVKPENIKELISEKDIDGALVGGASIEPESFSQIVKRCLQS